MMRRVGWVGVLAGVLALQALAAPDTRIEVTARHGKSVRGKVEGYPFLLLRGTHRERGVAHGYLAARDILKVLDEAFLPTLQKQLPLWEKMFVGRVDQFQWPARFEEELAGVLEGIREALPNAEDRVIKSLGREIGLKDLKAANALPDLFGQACSSFSAWGDLTPDGRTVTGRNLDYFGFPMSPYQCLVAVDPAEKELKPTVDFLVFGFVCAGTALNSEGVFVAMHDEPGLRGERKEGWVPRAITLRLAIESASAKTATDDVAAALRAGKVRVGNNIHLSFPVVKDGPVPCVFEWDNNDKGEGITIRRPDSAREPHALLCTNHYLERAVHEEYKDSLKRYDTLAQAVAKHREAKTKIGADEGRAMLDSVSRTGRVVTHLSVLVWPGTRRIAFAFSPGPGKSSTQGRWVTVEWADLFKN
jgi:hypothetical protein